MCEFEPGFAISVGLIEPLFVSLCVSRITGLLTIFKREFDDSHDKNDKNTADDTLTIGDKGLDMPKIAKEAEAIFGGPADTTEVDLDGKGGRTFLRVIFKSNSARVFAYLPEVGCA